VAEDNAVNQRVAVHMLERLGYQADVVADGREALEALSRIPYPLVLMDCQMPEMDGYAATAAIREREGTDRHTAIIAMTAGAMSGDRERCLTAGMDDYVAKPVRPAELAEVLGRWLPTGDASAPSAPSPPADEGPRIDRAMLATLGDPSQGGDPAFLTELVTVFSEETPRLLAALRSAVVAGDAGQVAATAHTLKGSSGYLGALGIQRLSERLEGLGRSESVEGATELVDQAEQEFTEVQVLLEQEVQRWRV
jgi:CheY-like chemotaxis protein